MSGNLTKQINVSIDEATFATLGEIYGRHRISRADIARATLEQVCAFYDAHGWFSLPVRIEPESFQLPREEAKKGKARKKE